MDLLWNSQFNSTQLNSSEELSWPYFAKFNELSRVELPSSAAECSLGLCKSRLFINRFLIGKRSIHLWIKSIYKYMGSIQTPHRFTKVETVEVHNLPACTCDRSVEFQNGREGCPQISPNQTFVLRSVSLVEDHKEIDELTVFFIKHLVFKALAFKVLINSNLSVYDHFDDCLGQNSWRNRFEDQVFWQKNTQLVDFFLVTYGTYGSEH